MRVFKKNRRPIKASNAIDPATTTSKKWGFKPIPGKGGATKNYDAELKKEEVEKIIHGGEKNA